MMDNIYKESLKSCENKNDEMYLTEYFEKIKANTLQSILNINGIVDAEQKHLWLYNIKTKPITKLTISFYGQNLDTCLYHYVFPPEICGSDNINYSKANNSIVFTYDNIPPKSKIVLRYGFKSILGIKPQIIAYNKDGSIVSGKQIFEANEYNKICAGSEINILTIIIFIITIIIVGFNLYIYKIHKKMNRKIDNLIQKSQNDLQHE